MQPRRPSDPTVPFERSQRLFRTALRRCDQERKLNSVCFVTCRNYNGPAIWRPRRAAGIIIMRSLAATDLALVATVNRPDHQGILIYLGKAADKDKALSVGRKANGLAHV